MPFYKKKKKQDEPWLSMLFATDQEAISNKLSEMAQKSAHMVGQAISALKQCDPTLCDQVKRSDDQVDQMELEIEDLCLGALALRQPVREDLRFIFAALKTVTDLERVGDQAVNIAKRTKILCKNPLFREISPFVTMSELACEMVIQAVQALIEEDEELAIQVIHNDDKVDNLNHSLYDELVNTLRKHHDNDLVVNQVTDLAMVCRNIERIGDHGANIAQRAYYTVTGRRYENLIQPKGENL